MMRMLSGAFASMMQIFLLLSNPLQIAVSTDETDSELDSQGANV